MVMAIDDTLIFGNLYVCVFVVLILDCDFLLKYFSCTSLMFFNDSVDRNKSSLCLSYVV